MENKIITPLLESGILSGVTRAKVIEIARKSSLEIEEKHVNSLFLKTAKSVFITNAIIGIMPVAKIKLEDKEYNFPMSSQITNLKNTYENVVQDYFRKSISLVSN